MSCVIHSTALHPVWVSVVMLFAFTSGAYSNPICPVLEELAKHPPAYDQTVPSATLFSRSDLSPEMNKNPANCEVSSSSQYLLTCTWQFPYRSPVATDSFTELRNLIAGCIDDPSGVTKDQNVNHPDYYEAYFFDFRHHVLSVAIKDKVGLGSTFVFMRMKPDGG